MIRVTFKDGVSWEYEQLYIEQLENKIYLLPIDYIWEKYDKQEIVKIEKQVKDLTLEECLKLKLYHIELFQDCVDFIDDEETSSYYEDYIDITALVKGQEE